MTGSESAHPSASTGPDNKQSLPVRYFDGQVHHAYAAEVFSTADGIRVMYQTHDPDGQLQTVEKSYNKDDLQWIGGIGQVLPAIELPQDARIELMDQQIPDWLHGSHSRMMHRVRRIEGSWRALVASLVLMVLVAAITYRWGVPLLAEQVAFQLPERTLTRVGQQAQDMLVEQTSPSRLSAQRQQQIRQLYLTRLGAAPAQQLVFRRGGELLGANALAIPNGTIIVTDELIELTRSNDEILAVLAHEQGHLRERHSLQQVLRGLGVSLLYVSLTGDAVSVLNALPIAVASARYSQQFELQADAYAVRVLQHQHIAPQALSDFLQRLAENNHEDANASDFMDSHPASPRRIAAIKE